MITFAAAGLLIKKEIAKAGACKLAAIKGKIAQEKLNVKRIIKVARHVHTAAAICKGISELISKKEIEE